MTWLVEATLVLRMMEKDYPNEKIKQEKSADKQNVEMIRRAKILISLSAFILIAWLVFILLMYVISSRGFPASIDIKYSG